VTTDTPSSGPAGPGARALLTRLIREDVSLHGPGLALAVAAMILAAAATAGLAWLLEPAIRLIFVDKRADMLVWVPLAVAVTAVSGAVAAYFATATLASIGQAVVARLQGRMFETLTGADLAALDSAHSGTYLSKLVYDATLVRDMVARGLAGLVRDSLTVVFLIGLMFWLDWILAALTLVALPLISGAMRLLSRRAGKAADAGMVETGALSAMIGEAAGGRRTVKAYGLEETLNARAKASIGRRLASLVKGERASAATIPISDALGGAGIALVIGYAGWRGIEGTLPLSEFMAFIAAALMAFQPIRALSSLTTIFALGLAALARVYAFLDTPRTIQDAKGAKALTLEGAGANLIVFDRVRFAYRDGLAALDGLTFSIARGERVALVGPSGSGKSTVLNLLLRFYEPQSGEIRIAGEALGGLSIASLRAQMALVTQEPFLFDETIAANIACARPGVTQGEIEAAAKAAAAHDFIAAMPGGYEARAGEAGGRLSGGQRQRVAIARAILKDAPILLLDEATSALDAASEAQVQAALETLMQGRTTLVIAHRLSTITGADRILVLDKGRIAEEGDHASLMAANGTYALLYRTQFDDAKA
jgi:ATP-binding cassette, subfamily B, bacterial MsbA